MQATGKLAVIIRNRTARVETEEQKVMCAFYKEQAEQFKRADIRKDLEQLQEERRMKDESNYRQMAELESKVVVA